MFLSGFSEVKVLYFSSKNSWALPCGHVRMRTEEQSAKKLPRICLKIAGNSMWHEKSWQRAEHAKFVAAQKLQARAQEIQRNSALLFTHTSASKLNDLQHRRDSGSDVSLVAGKLRRLPNQLRCQPSCEDVTQWIRQAKRRVRSLTFAVCGVKTAHEIDLGDVKTIWFGELSQSS